MYEYTEYPIYMHIMNLLSKSIYINRNYSVSTDLNVANYSTLVLWLK